MSMIAVTALQLGPPNLRAVWLAVVRNLPAAIVVVRCIGYDNP